MTDLLAARSQMAMSLAFHIVFAAVGIAMPLLMVIAEGLHLRTRNGVYRLLARRWAKGTAILFAVGAVSGTVLSFELGLLWPVFMDFAGPIVGMPFSMEGFAFFLEAIFLGVYLYGWDRVPPLAHLLTGVGVATCGALSALFVLAVNGWMNAPTGFDLAPDGTVAAIRPWEAMTNAAWLPQAAHMIAAAYLSVGFAVAGIHAFKLLREPDNASAGFGLGPRTIVATPALRASGLLAPGTLYSTDYRLDLPADADLTVLAGQARAQFSETGMRWRDSRNGAPGVRQFVERLAAFLVLVGLSGLAVGGVGVSAAVRAYLDAKTGVIATLKTLGAEGRVIFLTYFLQIGALAVLGITLGLILGAVMLKPGGYRIEQIPDVFFSSIARFMP